MMFVKCSMWVLNLSGLLTSYGGSKPAYVRAVESTLTARRLKMSSSSTLKRVFLRSVQCRNWRDFQPSVQETTSKENLVCGFF